MSRTKSLRSLLTWCIVAVLAATMLINSGRGTDDTPEKPPQIKRVGMVVGIDESQIDEYKRLHADDNPGVRDILSKYHMQNFSIFLQKMPDDKWYEFGYYEYTGNDFEGDMKKMGEEPRTIEWLKVCDPMQIPLPGAEGWTDMEQVYFNQ